MPERNPSYPLTPLFPHRILIYMNTTTNTTAASFTVHIEDDITHVKTAFRVFWVESLEANPDGWTHTLKALNHMVRLCIIPVEMSDGIIVRFGKVKVTK